MKAEVDEELTWEERCAHELLDYGLELLEQAEYDEEDKTPALIEIFCELLSGLMVAEKVMNPAISDSFILMENYDKLKNKYMVRRATDIIIVAPEEIN